MQKRDIDSGGEFDWGKTSEDYAKFRDIYPEEFYRKIMELGLCVQGQRVLDLGTGTGVLPRNLARYGAQFIGADISANQIEQAKELSQKAGLDIEYVVSPAEELTFDDNTFDVVTACQCFLYFDKSVLLPKLTRFLKPGGHLAVLFLSWLPDESEIARQSEELVLKYNPNWSGNGFQRYEPTAPDWAAEYFEVEQNIAFDIGLAFTRESWNGRIKACRGTGASLSPEQMQKFEKEHIELLGKIAPESFVIPHYATMLALRVKK